MRAVADLKQVIQIDGENKRARTELNKLEKFEEASPGSPLLFAEEEIENAKRKKE